MRAILAGSRYPAWGLSSMDGRKGTRLGNAYVSSLRPGPRGRTPRLSSGGVAARHGGVTAQRKAPVAGRRGGFSETSVGPTGRDLCMRLWFHHSIPATRCCGFVMPPVGGPIERYLSHLTRQTTAAVASHG